ncbi:hypothetical protein PUN28_005417 [Cardiocondyla obscurior]
MLGLILLVKIYTYQFNSRKIKDLTDRLFVDWDMLETKEEHDIMRKYAEKGRWHALMYGLIIYMSTIIFAITSLVPRILDVIFPLNTSRPLILPYPAYYFVDENEYFYYIFFHMLIACSICMTGMIAHDTMFFVYVEHICGLFAIVGFAQFLENTFTISFAIQLLFVTIGLSITLVQLSIQLHDLAEASRYVLFIIGQLFHLFCFSFQGQRVIDHSIETRDKIYHGLWYTVPAKEQRLLMFVIRRSIEASFLTAGKIYIFSLENFTTVVQSSVSYFTLLSSFDVS